MGVPVTSNRGTPRRPSRRDHIVQCAVLAFAREGFHGASVQEIAREANVVPTAVYYHFNNKEDLYDAALSHVLAQLDAVVLETRPVTPSGGVDFSLVIGAVWDWVEENADPSRLLYAQLPGATPRALQLRQEFEKRHIDRMVDYLPRDGARRGRRISAVQQTRVSLILRSLFHMGMNTHALRLGDGPLVRQSPKALRQAYIDVSLRMLEASVLPTDVTRRQ